MNAIQVIPTCDGLGFLYDRMGPDREQAVFLEAWLCATPGGIDAVRAKLGAETASTSQGAG